MDHKIIFNSSLLGFCPVGSDLEDSQTSLVVQVGFAVLGTLFVLQKTHEYLLENTEKYALRFDKYLSIYPDSKLTSLFDRFYKKKEEPVPFCYQVAHKVRSNLDSILKSPSPTIENPQPCEGVELFPVGDINLVWRVLKFSKVICKSTKSRKDGHIVLERFNKRARAKQVCAMHCLDRLIVPNAEIRLIGRPVIFEQYIDINQDLSAQEQFFLKNKDLDKAIVQLARFILITGFSDVALRNIPVIEHSGKSCIVLYDLETINLSGPSSIGFEYSVTGGIFGSIYNEGLIGCLHHQSQIENVVHLTKIYGFDVDSEASKRRLKDRIFELEKDKALEHYHQTKGIFLDSPSLKEIEFSSELLLKTIEFDEDDYLSEPERSEKMLQSIKYVKNLLNTELKKQQKLTTLKGQRKIMLNRKANADLQRIDYSGSSDISKQGWLEKIFRAMEGEGHIFRCKFSVQGCWSEIQC